MYKKEAKEIVNGVYRFSEPIGKRVLNFYGIKEENGWTLVDCGLPGSVEYWVNEGVIKDDILRLIITHCDADHFGSGAWLKAQYPDINIFCHYKDKVNIENHKHIVSNRYNVARPFFEFGYSKDTLDALLLVCGEDFKVDIMLKGGENLVLGGMEWNIIHIPGHSPGHIGLFRNSDGTFIMGDAFLADGPPDLSGAPSMPPTHEDVAAYLNSMNLAKKLHVNLALSGHWLELDKNAYMALLDKSKEVISRDIHIINSFLIEGEKSFGDIMEELNKKVSTWEAEENNHYLYALNGYLKYLEEKGKISFTWQKRIKRIN